MSACQYPGCCGEAVYFPTGPRTWLERVADLGGPGYCKAHEHFTIIDREQYDKAWLSQRATMEIMAIEDLAFLRAIDEVVRSSTA